MDTGSISTVPLSYPILAFPLLYPVLIVLLLLGGAYFAAAETSLASVSRIRMLSDASDGDSRAEKVIYILDNFEEALSTLLIGNNIMHIGCSAAATVFATKLWGSRSVSISTFVLAFIVFIFAEMIPKSYAKACCEKLAPALAPSLAVLMKIFAPANALLNALTSAIARAFHAVREDDITLSGEELSDIIENIDEEDRIDEDTTELLQSALEFTETNTKDILIAWDKVVTVGEWMPEDEIYRIISENHFSRLPVLDRDGNIKGVLQIRKFLKAKIRGRKSLMSASMLDKPYYIQSTLNLDEILSDLSGHRTHMAFVKNGSNQVIGIITIEDILEELVGEIYDEEEAAV